MAKRKQPMHYGTAVTGKAKPRQRTRCGLTVPEARATASWKQTTCGNCLRAGKRATAK